jgi:hypothetical protein
LVSLGEQGLKVIHIKNIYKKRTQIIYLDYPWSSTNINPKTTEFQNNSKKILSLTYIVSLAINVYATG